MSNACIKQGLIILAALAALIGCSGPSVIVEERWTPEKDRPKGFQVKNLAPGKIGKKQSPAPSLCDNGASHLIHPLHFGTGNNANVNAPCPLLFWEVRTVKDEITPSPK